LVGLGNGICLQSGAPATSGDDRNLRFDNSALGLSVMPEVKRTNLFVTGNYQVTEQITAFTEVGFYNAKTSSLQAPVATTSAQVITAPDTSF
jgi:hypothetical protein